MSKQTYNLHLKGYVGGWDFDSDVIDTYLSKHQNDEIHVLIDSLGGSLAQALSIVASFKNHGNVHVHYVGMNASAATIASLGAKHVSIDSSAMYLVHKCSMEFFQWASANSDKLSDIIKEAEQMKADLDKMDANVAQMYAAKCKRDAKDLLDLMKQGGWLTAKEALDWGFVDEITDYEDDAAPVIDDKIAAYMGANGIPVPASLASKSTESNDNVPASAPDRLTQNIATRIVDAIANLFKPSKPETMNPETQTPSAQAPQVPEQTPATQTPAAVETPSAEATAAAQATAEAHAKALADKDAEITALKAEIAALKAKPGDSTSHVVDTQKKNERPEDDPSSPEAFINARNRAKALFDELPEW